MDRLFDKLKRMENLYEKNKSIKNSVLLIFRYWSAYRFIAEVNYLKKAYYIAVSAEERNPADLKLRFIRIFLELESGETDKSDETLLAIDPYKNYFKQNEPENYCIYLFLSALKDLKTFKDRSASKKIKLLGEIEHPYKNLPLLLAYLEIERADYQNAYSLLNLSLKNGYNSFFSQMGLFMVFVEKAHVRDTGYLFTGFIKWSIAAGLYHEKCVDFYQSSIITKNSRDIGALKLIYANYPKRWLLELICQNLITRFDYSPEAYRYYRDAETKQLMINNLETHLVRASFVNKNENIAHFTMANFLKHYNNDYNLKSFVYHLLVSNDKYKDLADANCPEILEFTASALKEREHGRYYYSLYAYYLRKAKAAENSLFEACRDILYENLLCYEATVTNPEIKYIWVFDKEKKEHSVFETTHNPPYQPRVKIKSVSKSLSYLCFDKTQHTIISEQLEFKKSVVNADMELYGYFQKLHPDDGDLAIVMARYYIDAVDTAEESIDTLNKALTIKSISRNFRMQVTASLGNLLASLNRYDKAIEYYNVVDENYLSDRYIEQMLISFINAKEYEKAVRLIIKKSHCVSDRTLFFALKQVALFEKYHQSIADVAYELVLKSWYDKNLINIVIKHYNGSQQDYQELGKALASIQAPEIMLDKKILENCIGMNKLDTASQKVFARMYSSLPDADVIDNFIYYLCYEILILNKRIENETLDILEKHFANTKDRLLAYSLTHYYINMSLTTQSSNEIISQALSFMEEDGLLFECAAAVKDKSMLRPYIIKNQPFVYRTLPNKNVFLYYRIDNTEVSRVNGAKYRDDETYRIKMKYFRFGMYMCSVPHFYNEKLIYYFSEEMSGGSISTAKMEVTNTRVAINENTEDMYFTINNALIYEQMFRYNEVEKIITSSLQAVRKVKGKIL